jgi:hypothetical protein
LKLVPSAYANDCTPGADGAVNLGNCLKLNEEKTVQQIYSSPADLVNPIVYNLFIISGVILFILVIYAGFLFIQGTTKGKDQAATVISTAVVGFIVMFAAYWIIQIIEIVIGMQILP